MNQRISFEREMGLLVPPADVQPLALEVAEGLRRRITNLSLLPHRAEQAGKDVALTPAVADPKIYDGSTSYRIAKPLQDFLMAVMKQSEFAHISVAIADLTNKASAPDFAGFKHKQQLFAASVAKIAVMLAAFQLRHDLHVAAATGKFAKIDDLFSNVRDDWAATQVDPGGTPQPFSGPVKLRGKLVTVGGAKVGFRGKTRAGKEIEVPKAPRLETILDPIVKGRSFTVEFNKSGETRQELQALVNGFNLSDEEDSLESIRRRLRESNQELGKARTRAERTSAAVRKKDAEAALRNAQQALKEAEKKQPEFADRIKGLGFLERLGIAIGGAVPASNLAMSTVVADVGFHYIASTLLQTGLYDPNRKGGLWLGADYWTISWRGGLVGGVPQSATAASLAAFMVLLAQGALVSPAASAEMRSMMQKPSPKFPGTGSWSKDALRSRSPKLLLAKVGLASGGADELAYIERDVEGEQQNNDGTKTKKTIGLRYVVATLRARKSGELIALIRELDNCILANNGLSASVGMRLPSKA